MRINCEHDVDVLGRAAKLLAVIAGWSELGLWKLLAERDSPVELGELPADTRALSITAPLLAHAGLLDGAGSRWKLSRVGRGMVERDELPGARNLNWFEDLRRMPDVLRRGGPVRDADGTPKVTSGGVRPHDREATRAFLDMLYRRCAETATSCAEWMADRLPAGAAVLDVGGGHGRYSRALADRGFTVTLFDMDMVVELARERHGDALGYAAGNFHDDAFGGGPYGAALLSNIVHGESDAQNADLLRRLAAALEPGGYVVIKDMFIDEQGRDPEDAVVFGISMLYYTRAGRSYALADVARWGEAAGLSAPEIISADGMTLAFLRKPA